MTTLKAPEDIVIGFENSTPLLDDPQALRDRAERDGFLFFKQILPKEPLLELRRQIVDILGQQGWLAEGSDPMEARVDLEAVAASDREDEAMKYIGITQDAYKAVQRLELFHALPHRPELIDIFEKLFQGPVLPHPRHIARVLVPSPSLAFTPPHQDYIHIQGTHGFWTCWFPLGDCPMDLGGLSMLRGSHKEDVLDVAEAEGAGGRETILCGKDHYKWMRDDYECGDIIIFPSHMVHKGTPNAHPDLTRLSLDIRYQPVNEPVCFETLLPHTHGLGQEWEDIYRNWESDQYKYYWKDLNLEVEGKDNYWSENIKEKIC